MKHPTALIFLACLLTTIVHAQQGSLDIYWIDVEGGSATLIVTPERESVLMDSGWSLPDDAHAKRIVAAMAFPAEVF